LALQYSSLSLRESLQVTCPGEFADGMLEHRCWELPRFDSSECYWLPQGFQFFWIPSPASRSKVSVRPRRSSQRVI